MALNNQNSPLLMARLEKLIHNEEELLSLFATKSSKALRRCQESLPNYRQQFALDSDRILHSRAYIRYIDKTQVFSLVTNDHITHRNLHVQLVARIARTVGRFLKLNEDLIEAIALGHDIGHPPFGHDGEKFLQEICLENNLPPFQHNIQSVRFLDKLEKKGRGWNLTLQVLDGILCHDGEAQSTTLTPQPIESFIDFDEKLTQKENDPQADLSPATPEGCVVRLADTIGYIGKDIEDAIILGLIKRGDIPQNCSKRLGSTNGTIVYNLVTDLITNSYLEGSHLTIGFSKEVASLLLELKKFNYDRIYLAPEIKTITPAIKECYRTLFSYYLNCIESNNDKLPDRIDLMTDIEPLRLEQYTSGERVRDFIAGMTDRYFLAQAKNIGCTIPKTN